MKKSKKTDRYVKLSVMNDIELTKLSKLTDCFLWIFRTSDDNTKSKNINNSTNSSKENDTPKRYEVKSFGKYN